MRRRVLDFSLMIRYHFRNDQVLSGRRAEPVLILYFLTGMRDHVPETARVKDIDCWGQYSFGAFSA